MNKSPIRHALLIVLASLAFFSIQLGEPRKHDFDEFHYIPAAQEFLKNSTNRNWEHPPLGKYLIAGGLAIFGDTPIGWRASAVVFGALTMGAVFLWAFTLFGAVRSAWVATLLVLFGQLHLVQSRLGTLDVFAAFFAVIAGWAFTRLWMQPKAPARWLLTLGISLGLGAATKWMGLLLWAAIGLWIWARSPGARFRVILYLAALPTLTYFATFLPLLGLENETYDLSDLFTLQQRMWDGMRNVGVAAHGYSSEWWSWPLLLRPIWYHYERSPDQRLFRGVLLVGNALLFWASPLALAYAAWNAKRHTESRPLLWPLLFLWTALYLLWALVPRAGGFFYYYYPASFPMLLIWTWVLLDLEKRWRTRLFTHAMLVASGLLFVWFYPVLTGAFQVPVKLSTAWMWFTSWI